MKLFLIFDDREFAKGEIRTLIGGRRYGQIIFKRVALIERFRGMLPEWARGLLFHLRTQDDLDALRSSLELGTEDATVCLISARAGFPDPELLLQFIERLPFARENFTDRLYKPLIVFLDNAHWLVEHWDRFAQEPLSNWPQGWQNAQRLQSVQPLDLSRIRDFLLFTSGSTVARHFNEVSIDEYHYTKSSLDRRKMLAEYSFHGLVPQAMRPWLIEPFDYREETDGRASYRMLRYYLADAALQWVHGAFEADAFEAFVDRLLFFVSIRTRKPCDRSQSLQVAGELFVDKVKDRVQRFLSLPEGRRVDALAASSSPHLAIEIQLERYLRLYKRYEKLFQCDFLAIGHGDPCFSNILYDQQRYLMKLIDPKGAVSEADLWTHPLYDLCKISHSALGDYDFINNGLYAIDFSRGNEFSLEIRDAAHPSLKKLFRQRIEASEFSYRAMRLGEASLFLSMLPLHLDYPNKVLAFMLKAHEILDEVENG